MDCSNLNLNTLLNINDHKTSPSFFYGNPVVPQPLQLKFCISNGNRPLLLQNHEQNLAQVLLHQNYPLQQPPADPQISGLEFLPGKLAGSQGPQRGIEAACPAEERLRQAGQRGLQAIY
ncbi:hypothetical protein SLE2022_188430 [Rubroshorea leprosula]